MIDISAGRSLKERVLFNKSGKRHGLNEAEMDERWWNLAKRILEICGTVGWAFFNRIFGFTWFNQGSAFVRKIKLLLWLFTEIRIVTRCHAGWKEIPATAQTQTAVFVSKKKSANAAVIFYLWSLACFPQFVRSHFHHPSHAQFSCVLINRITNGYLFIVFFFWPHTREAMFTATWKSWVNEV